MIYDVLFLQSTGGKIRMDTHKPVGQLRRAVRSGFRIVAHHKGLSWDKTFGKWTDQPPSEHSLLRVSKQIFQETVTVAYGANTFELDDMKLAAIFFKGLGSMRQYLGALHFTGNAFYSARSTYTRLRNMHSVFSLLKDAKALRTFTFAHQSVCHKPSPNYYWGSWRRISPEVLVNAATPVLKAIKRAKQKQDEDGDVSNILAIEPSKEKSCNRCKDIPAGTQCQKPDCNAACKDLASHCEETVVKLQSLVDTELAIDS